MTASLDDLFDQIINSERLAHEKKNRLNDIRHAVNEAKASIADRQRHRVTLQQQLASQVEKLNEEKMNLTWLQRREQILRKQKHMLLQERQQLIDQTKNLEEQMTKKNEDFCKEVEWFLADYGLRSCGPAQRRKAAQASREKLIEEEKCLCEDADKYSMRRLAVDELRHLEQQLQEELEKSIQQNTDKAQELENENENLQHAEREHDTLKRFTTTNPEYVRLCRELDESKSENLEKKCGTLQQEVQKLQQQLWQKRNTKPITTNSTVVDEQLPTSNRLCISNFQRKHQAQDSSGLNSSSQTKFDDDRNGDHLEEVFKDDFI